MLVVKRCRAMVGPGTLLKGAAVRDRPRGLAALAILFADICRVWAAAGCKAQFFFFFFFFECLFLWLGKSQQRSPLTGLAPFLRRDLGRCGLLSLFKRDSGRSES